MIQIESELPAPERRCGEAVDRLLARHDWRLLEHQEFVRRAAEHLRAGVATDPGRAATHTYSQALHAACSGAAGPERQNLGYAELFRFLYDSARRRYPNVCDDATQRALERTFATFGRCRQPGAFLAFAFGHLIDAVRVVRRQAGGAQSLATPVGEGDDTLGEVLPDPQPLDPVLEALADEQRAHVVRCAAAFLRQHPRAGQQLAALWLKYIEGLDDRAIGHRLGKPVASVYVLRARAIEKLRAEPGWRALAGEYGIIPGGPSAVGVAGANAEPAPARPA